VTEDGGQCNKPMPTNGQTPSIQPAPPIAGAPIVDVTRVWQQLQRSISSPGGMVITIVWGGMLRRHVVAALEGGGGGVWRVQGKGVVLSSGGASNVCIAAQQANSSTGGT